MINSKGNFPGRNHRHVLVDIDGVLASLEVLRETLNLDTGRELSSGDWNTYDLTSLYGISYEKIFDAFSRHDVIRRAAPLPGAQQALALLKKDYTVHIVTHRGWHPEGLPDTRDWLAKHGMTYDTLTVVEFGKEKSEVYRGLAPKFEAFFEDSLANLADAEQSGLVNMPIVIDQPWNQHCGNKYRKGASRFQSLLQATHHIAAPSAEPVMGIC